MENGEQFGDLPQFVDFAYTARVARVNGAALANLAWAPTAPKDAKIDTTQLTNDTDADVGRPTPSPTSRATRSCGARRPSRCGRTRSRSATSRRYTIPDLSKDNVQFGVRAVDRDGYRSPVAFPVPST